MNDECALILAALDVEDQHILADYLLTAQRIDRYQLSRDQQLALLGAADLPVSRRVKCRRPSKPTRPWFIAMRRR